MLQTDGKWRDFVSQVYRGPGILKFAWIPNGVIMSPFNATYSARGQTVGTQYANKTFRAYNGNTFGDDIACLEYGRWLLNGTKHSVYLNNQIDEDTAKSPYRSSSYMFKDPGNNPTMVPGNADLSSDIEIATGTPGYNKYAIPNGSISIRTNFEFDMRDTKQYIETDNITIIWDPQNKCGAPTFSVRCYLNGAQVASSGSIRNDTGHWISEVSLGNTYQFDAIVLTVSSWCLPSSAIRVAQIGFGPLITDEHEDVSITDVAIEKQCSDLYTENTLMSCTITMDNTSKWIDPLGKKGISKLLTREAPFFMWWELEDIEGNVATTAPECWTIKGFESATDSNDFKILLGFEGDFLIEECTPSIALVNNLPATRVWIYQWFHKLLQYNRLEKHQVSTFFNESQKSAVVDTAIANSADIQYLQNKETQGYPKTDSLSEALLQLAQVCGAIISKDNTVGTIYLKIPKDTGVVITEDNILSTPRIYFDTHVDKIKINTYTLLKSVDEQRVEVSVEPSDFMDVISVDYPSIEQTIEGYHLNTSPIGIPGNIYATNCTFKLVSDSGRRRKILITGASEGAQLYFYVWSGKTSLGDFAHGAWYEQIATRVYSLTTGTDTLEIDNPFISWAYMAKDLYEMLKEKVVNNMLIEFQYTGFPELEPGDIIEAHTEYGNYKVLLLKTTLNFNGGFSGTLQGRIMEVLS